MAEPARAKSSVKTESDRKRSADYSKQYWWLAAIAVLLLVAVIGKYPLQRDTPVRGTIYIGNMTVIERQYQQYVGQPLTDPNVKRKFQQANELVATSNFQDAPAVIQEIAEKVPVPAVFNNLGVLYQSAGDPQHAKAAYQQALQKDLSYGPAKTNLKTLEELSTAPQPTNIISVTNREREPNNEISQANAIQLNTGIAAAIANSSDKDTFAFQTPPSIGIGSILPSTISRLHSYPDSKCSMRTNRRSAKRRLPMQGPTGNTISSANPTPLTTCKLCLQGTASQQAPTGFGLKAPKSIRRL